MAKNVATVEINVTGNLMPIAHALIMMSEALKANGHQWSADDERVIEEALERVCEAAGSMSDPDTITLPRRTVAALTAAAEAWFSEIVERPEANGSPRLLELGAALRTASTALEDVVG